ncbi:MAG: TonB-dependent receptor domain-containing protein [Thermoanaerobaculia bacterium]
MKHEGGYSIISPHRRPAMVLILTLVVILAGALSLGAQTTSTIKGSVTNEAGETVAGADVVATNVASGFTTIAQTKEDGTFVLGGLAPGRYTILIASAAYEQKTDERIVSVGQTLDLVFKMAPATVLTESITVVGNTFVETKTSQVATNITEQQIETLPQNDRNFLNFAALAPGVLLGNDELRKEIKAGAQGSSAINVFIDGVSFKNDVLQGGVVGQDASRGNPFPQNAVQEFKVITQNYSAEYQKASSAIITAVTKSGGNAFTGDAFWFYQDKDLVSENPLNGADPEYSRDQFGFNFGGPIVRDKLHFFASYEANNQDREETVVIGGGFQNFPDLRAQAAQYEGTFVSPFRSDLAFAKLSYQPDPKQVLDLSFNYRSETDIRGFGGGTSREAAENVENDVAGIVLHHQFVGGDWLNQASASYQDFAWNPQPLNPDLVGFEYEGLIRIGGRDTEQDIGQTRLSLRDDFSFAPIRAAGNHSLKTGVILEFLDYNVTKYFEENPRYFFRSDISATIPYKARYGLGDPDLSTSNEEFGIYIQDEWTPTPRMIVNLGLRWDYETNMFNTDYVTPVEVRERLGDEFSSNYFTDGNDRSAKTDMFQPRLGISYDLTEDGKTVVFAGAGRYYDRGLFNNILDEMFRLQHSVGEFFFSEDGSPVFGQPAVEWDPRYLTEEGLQEILASGRTGKPEVFLIENDTEVPYSDQWNIGIRHTFGNIVGSLTYSQVRSKHGFSFLWGKGFCCPQLDPNYSNVLISSDDIKTWYDAIYLTVDRPYDSGSRYGYNIAYTYAEAEQIGGDLFSLDLPTIGDWPRYGTPGTQDHRIVANGIVGLPWDMRGSTIIQYSSGDKFRINDFSKGFCVGCYVPRTGEGPSWTTIDLRLEKDFRISGSYVGLSLEAFNVTNDERYAFFQDFNPPEGNPNLGQPTAIVGGSQRRYQVGLRFGF